MPKFGGDHARNILDWQSLTAKEQFDVVANLDQDVDALKVINAFAVDLIAIPSKEDLAWYVAREVVGKLGFDDCVVYYVEESGNHLKQYAAIGADKNPVSNEIVNPLEIPIGDGVTGHVAQTRTPAIVDDLRDDPRYIPDVRPARSEICVPLIVNDVVVGVIDSEDERVAAYNEFHLEILTTVAALASAKLRLLDQDEAMLMAKRLTDLTAAIEAMSGPVAVFDEHDNFVFTNEAYRTVNNASPETIAIGEPYDAHIRSIVEKGVITDAIGDEEAWIAERLRLHRLGNSSLELRDSESKWFLCTEEKLPSGGQVLLMTDITKIKESQAITENANRAKTVFLSSLSHELRTPMNAIIGFAQLLDLHDKGTLSAKQRKSVDRILSSGRHMLDLIEDAMELNKIEAGRADVNPEWVDVHDVIDDSLRFVQGMDKAERVAVLNETRNTSLPRLWVDQRRLTQILVNLLSNAIKYNKPDGSVTVTCEMIGDRFLRIKVTDTGMGMSAEAQGDVFAPFERLGRESGEIEGTGIGLTIAKQLIELLGGRVGFESAEGAGSTFWVDAPTAPPA